MEQEKNSCEIPEVNSKTKLGLTFKEFIWIISLVIGSGYLYADIKNEMANIQIKIQTIEQRQEGFDAELEKRREIDSENYKNILLELKDIKGDMKLKQDRF
jgi:hypothetical protein